MTAALAHVVETDFYGDSQRLGFDVEHYFDVIEEMRQLYPEHLAEVEGALPLEMDYPAYEILAATGMLHVVTARDGEGKLVGYNLSIIHPHLHHRSVLTSFSDGFYLQPEHRRGFTGYKMLKFAVESMRERGVRQIYLGSAATFDLGPLLERLGFKLAERVYQKVFA